ncbi:conserved hypothetical protein (DUF4294) [Formosa agariphila KMM 3901]|uniref:DUF4294 domain-containing protein n=1 Tax=Formosa agariphila (strain DSM 15362 / KCTC 12365 / LMG 23005 / KMM 3901 / M-2Alg 35-1) TaxID=1347342 RepID=T2KKJ0_FORAG|nr:DUF4294 domain-containing protein [Formosa agariphila]CDF78958.1 conserved hypothetical protein (DUF4294) [Formosa agariphila KMM 3901]
MKFFLLTLLLFPCFAWTQIEGPVQDSIQDMYIIIEGDSIVRTSIDLDEVMILNKIEFVDKKEHYQYLILRRKTLKVYPYAKLAADRLQALKSRLDELDKTRLQKRYIKQVQKYLEDEFSAELKKMTRTEGQILVKLIHRQTGITTFDLIKDLRSGWRAFWFNNTAKIFDISLKEEFNPMNSKEDYFIEDILERNFQNGKLERQNSVLDFDFYEAENKWSKRLDVPKPTVAKRSEK